MSRNVIIPMKSDEDKVIPIRHDELLMTEFIMFYQGYINTALDKLKDRLKQADGWKYFRCGEWMINRAMESLYQTLPEKTLKHLDVMSRASEIVVRVKHISSEHSATYLPNEDLEVLIHYAMQGKCEVCLEEGKSAKACKLRKVFEYCCPPKERYDGTGTCPYSNGCIEGMEKSK